MSPTATVEQRAAIFPEKAVEREIEKWWNEQTSKQLDDPFAEPGTLFDVLVDMDSLTAVNILLEIEPILGVHPPESLIRPGGYTDRNDMIGHLLPALRKFFNQHNRKPTAR